MLAISTLLWGTGWKALHYSVPPKTGSLFWNYNKSFSISLLGLIDSKYKFIMIDVGACGTEGDSNTFQNCAFGQQFMAEIIPFLKPCNLPDTYLRAPFAIIADKAFPSMINLLKPYPKRSKQATKKAQAIFNYRLLQACMTIECTFGILSSRFRFLLCRMMLSPSMATVCVEATCVLHNFLLKDSDTLVQEIEAKTQQALEEARDLNVSRLAGVSCV